MNCMKCGAETPEGQVFCDHCLSVMEDYPIKPDTRIHLPKRDDPVEAPKRSPRKKRLTQEEQISALRLKVLRLRLTAVILALLLCVAGVILGQKMYKDFTKPVSSRRFSVSC